MWRHIPLMVVMVGLALLSRLPVFAEKAPTLMVFTASWCASCRDVLPAVTAYASSKGYGVQIVDIDSASAEGLTRQMGLTLKQVAPPMVYFINAGKNTLIIDQSSDHGQTSSLLQQKVK